MRTETRIDVTTPKRFFRTFAPILLFVACIAGCVSNRNSENSKASVPFSLTNAVMDGEQVQVLRSTFGLGIVPTSSNFVARFATNGYLTVAFDEKTVKPRSILLRTEPSGETLGRLVFDMNADGIPDMREIDGQGRQIYYERTWYSYRRAGTNVVIMYQGRKKVVYFDGENWRENTNAPAPPTIESKDTAGS